MILFPNAKINLGLYITEKRRDGFHNIESVFYPVELCDILEFIPNKTGQINFNSSGIEIDAPSENNLCIQAYKLIRQKKDLPGLDIHLRKIIPIGAGLGGGSADAAFMLKGLNDYFALKLSNSELKDMAAALGSDCAFFIDNNPALATQRGDVLEPVLMGLSWLSVIVVYPNIHVSTKEAYSNIIPNKPAHDLKETIEGSFMDWKDMLKNDFEGSIAEKYPVIQEIKNKLYDMGAVYASMTGSGSAVYGIFNKIPEENPNWPKDYFVWNGKLK
ncbi:MAG: 4-(cytidine 5'-diphospho)-2-C-methyl-D-erythritol kinase [Bacteroidetes bacterium]|jgi:4-diphosphocytidyl-2-C-methyl-D-erythritol kinase|nr:4-(cytidine 5'-diphospho)-2-C-methyl-D-erythritol kinase [Bacteroidota bacterium]